MGLPGEDDAFELRVGKDGVQDERRRQGGAIAGAGRTDIGHRGGLYKRGGVLHGAADSGSLSMPPKVTTETLLSNRKPAGFTSRTYV